MHFISEHGDKKKREILLCMQQVSLLLSRVNSFTWHEGEALSSGCTQASTGCINSSQAYKIHKVLHLTGGTGIPLTFCASVMTLIQSG